MIRHLALKGGLQQPFRQLLKQTALGLGPGHKFVQEPVIHAYLRGAYLGRCGYVLAGHRCNPP